jgi:predicted nucleotidyltransferase
MSISPREALAFLRRRMAETAADDERAAARLRSRLPAVADVLVREFGVTRIILFGSLAEGLARDDSDIDLAVAGLAPADYFRALGRTEQAAGGRVDLVPIDEASPELLRRIEETGEVLHGPG